MRIAPAEAHDADGADRRPLRYTLAMQAAIITGKEIIELLEFAEPVPAVGQAVVRISYCGICGTDLHSYQSGAPSNPAICGHEWTGEVAAVGAGVTNVREGDRVIGGIVPACGSCDTCRAGHARDCPNQLASLMATPHGGFAPAIAADARRLTAVPAGLDDLEAAMVEPLTVALHATRRTDIRLGDSVLVLGAGPIGLLVLQCARAAGAGRVFVVEPSPVRAALASELGADRVFDPQAEDVTAAVADETGGLGPDIVFECAGISPTIQQAVDLVRRGGAVTMVGLANEPATINPGAWISREVTVVASVAYSHEEFALAADLIASGRVLVRPLHTHTAPLAEIVGAFSLLNEDRRQIKVLVDPRAG